MSEVGIHVVGTYCEALGLSDETAKTIVFKTPGQGMTWLEQAEAMGITMTLIPTKEHQNGHFSTAALDEQDQAMAHFRDGGPTALGADLDACYAAYQRRRVEAIGFRCFFLEGLASGLVKDQARKDGRALNPYFSQKGGCAPHRARAHRHRPLQGASSGGAGRLTSRSPPRRTTDRLLGRCGRRRHV